MNSSFGGRRLLLSLCAASFLAVGCGDSENFVFTNAGGAPVAVNDTVNALGNATLNQSAANGVLANDAPNGAGISAFDAISTQGGAVNLQADGSFTYTPVFGFTGTDTFTYTLGAGATASTATVTLNVPNLGFFIDNSVAAGGSGAQADPFNALADGIAAAGVGDTIFVFRGDGTNNNLAGAVNLPAGVNLVGEGAGLVVAQTIVPPGNEPQLTGPITCNGNNTVSGLNISGSAGDGIVANTVDNITITDNTFGTPDANGNQVDLDDVGGTVTITGNTFQTPGANEECIQVEVAVNATYNISNNNFSNDGSQMFQQALEFDSRGNAVVAVTASDNTITGPNNTMSFSEGLDIQSNNTSQLTATIERNNITNTGDDAIDTDAEDTSTLTVTANNNICTTPASAGLDVDTAGAPGATVTYSATGNTVTNAGGASVFLGVFEGNARVTFINNSLDGAFGDGIFCSVIENGNATYILRDNTVTNVGRSSIHCQTFNTATLCADITGNTLEGDLELDNGGGTQNIERLDLADGGPLDTVNTLTAGAVTQAGGITSQPAGFCTP